jgi:hypothetical protein
MTIPYPYDEVLGFALAFVLIYVLETRKPK